MEPTYAQADGPRAPRVPSLHPSPTCGVCTNPDCLMAGQPPKRTRTERSSHTHELPLHVAQAASKRGSLWS